MLVIPFQLRDRLVYSYVYSEQKYGKSEENLRGAAEEVFWGFSNTSVSCKHWNIILFQAQTATDIWSTSIWTSMAYFCMNHWFVLLGIWWLWLLWAVYQDYHNTYKTIFGFFKLASLLATAPSCVAIVYRHWYDRQLWSRSLDGGNINVSKWVIEGKNLRNKSCHIVVLFKQLNIDIERVQPIIVSPNSDFLKGFESIHWI